MPGNPILGASGECAVWKKGDREFETPESFSLMLVDQEFKGIPPAPFPGLASFYSWESSEFQ